MRGLRRFDKKGKLSPRYVGPFEVLERIDTLAYRLALPPNLFHVHNVFHVSMLRKYEPDSTHVLNYEEIDVDDRVSYVKKSVRIDDRMEQVLWNMIIPMVKVIWKHHGIEGATLLSSFFFLLFLLFFLSSSISFSPFFFPDLCTYLLPSHQLSPAHSRCYACLAKPPAFVCHPSVIVPLRPTAFPLLPYLTARRKLRRPRRPRSCALHSFGRARRRHPAVRIPRFRAKWLLPFFALAIAKRHRATLASFYADHRHRRFHCRSLPPGRHIATQLLN
ncbi:hypothetical protein NL676_034169 [Syzygium grande]|nr:hypothetical protein NL676_034169 [Syzygium grande]